MAYKLEIRPLAALEVFEAYDWIGMSYRERVLGLNSLTNWRHFIQAYFAIPPPSVSTIKLYDKVK